MRADIAARRGPVGSPAFRLVLALSLMLVACGRSTKNGSDSPAPPGGAPEAPTENGAGQGQGMEPVPDPTCVDGMPTAAELAETPRRYVDLEMLALKASPGIVAEAAAYERVVRDVGAIKGMYSEVADISFWPGGGGEQISLMVDGATYAAMQDGRYTAWNCLNEAYVVQEIEYLGFGSFNAYVTLEGMYQLERLAAQYATLPGVMMAAPANSGWDGPTICLTPEGAQWHYVFDRASGDCALGCIDHEYRHFTTDASGTVLDLGALSQDQVALYASYTACH